MEVEAVQYLGDSNLEDLQKFVGTTTLKRLGDQRLGIQTLEGVMEVKPTDWVIRGVAGEFYPCRADIFDKTYEEVPSK